MRQLDERSFPFATGCAVGVRGSQPNAPSRAIARCSSRVGQRACARFDLHSPEADGTGSSRCEHEPKHENRRMWNGFTPTSIAL